MSGAEFLLERRFNWFRAELKWMEQDCLVFLDCDRDDGENGGKALDTIFLMKTLLYTQVRASSQSEILSSPQIYSADG